MYRWDVLAVLIVMIGYGITLGMALYEVYLHGWNAISPFGKQLAISNLCLSLVLMAVIIISAMFYDNRWFHGPRFLGPS